MKNHKKIWLQFWLQNIFLLSYDFDFFGKNPARIIGAILILILGQVEKYTTKY